MADRSGEQWLFTEYDPSLKSRPLFDHAWAVEVIRELANRGIIMESGLTSSELTRIEAAVGAELPPGCSCSGRRATPSVKDGPSGGPTQLDRPPMISRG
jgi:hypothetical protein